MSKKGEKSPPVHTSLYIPADLHKEVQRLRVALGYTKDNSFYLEAIREKVAREKRKK